MVSRVTWVVVALFLWLCNGASTLAQDKAIDGTILYQKLCSSCHGKSGVGDGIASRYLFPKPRDLRHDQFRLVSTLSHNPSRDDIYRVLEKGIPGTSMQSWKSLGDEKITALVERVQQIRRDGAVERIRQELREAGDAAAEAEQQVVDDYVRRVTVPGEPWEGVGNPPRGEDVVARGEATYRRQKCASCHGNDGRGSFGMDLVDLSGDATWATDLVRGRLHGGVEGTEIARRIFLGMPGSAMPSSTNLSNEDLAALVAYCMSLSVMPKKHLTNHQRRERAIGRIKSEKAAKSP